MTHDQKKKLHKAYLIGCFSYFYSMNRSITIRFLYLLMTCTIVSPTFAQHKTKQKQRFERSPVQELIYDDKAYLPAIRSVQCYPNGKENRLPVYHLDGSNSLLLTFDDLRADVRNYYVAIEHCNKDWTPSRATVLDYVEGFNEDRIEDFTASKGTFQPYTRYSIAFPTNNIRPKLAGNYLLKVYEDADKQRLIITKRFYVVNNLVNIAAQVQNSLQVAKRLHNQKLNVTLTTALTIANPQRDLTVTVLQNQRRDCQMSLQNPNFSGNNEFKYTHSETLDFKGNNEFRFVDLRSFRVPSERMRSIRLDSLPEIDLYTDEDHQNSTYASTFDENGRFYLRNRDLNDEDIDGDYATVNFSFKTDQQINGSIYLVGGFNNFQRHAENQLRYDKDTGLWKLSLPLKQGLYDYEYVLEDQEKQVQTDRFSGSHFQTGNDYQIFIYVRRMGTYWDELVGYNEVSINNRQ